MPLFVKKEEMKWLPHGEYVNQFVLAGEKVMAVINKMAPGGDFLPPHQHDDEQIVYMLQGRLEYHVGKGKKEKVVVAEPGMLIYFESQMPHGAKVLGKETAIALDVFSPPKKSLLDKAVKSVMQEKP